MLSLKKPIARLKRNEKTLGANVPEEKNNTKGLEKVLQKLYTQKFVKR